MNNNQEILPSPNTSASSLEVTSTDMVDETSASKMTELSGSTGVTGANPLSPPNNGSKPGAQVSSMASAAVSSVGMVSLTSDLDAQDVDLIEKEWIRKAKDIVAMTLNDPHEQNKQLNQMKKEYIQKRFNKTLKLRDE